MSEKFYDFHDGVWDVVRKMLSIQNDVEEKGRGGEEISLNHFCIARHDKNIVVAFYYSNRRGHNQELQFPLSYMTNPGWEDEYRSKLVAERDNAEKAQEAYKKERDMSDIARLKQLYPEYFVK